MCKLRHLRLSFIPATGVEQPLFTSEAQATGKVHGGGMGVFNHLSTLFIETRTLAGPGAQAFQ